MESELFECVPNFSEGRRPEVVDAIRRAACSVRDVECLHVTLDETHHRSVLTLVGPGERLVDAIRAAAGVAVQLIDMNYHEGVHPRIGALDVCPFVPLALEGRAPASISQAVALAKSCADRLWTELSIPSVFYEAAAASDDERNLAVHRRSGFEQRLEAGICHPTAGVTAIGARDILVAFNVQLATTDMRVAKRIARSIRESSGGLKAVKALGIWLEHRQCAQVSMNLVDYRTTGVVEVFDVIAEHAAAAGVDVLDSELIGLLPRAALDERGAEHVRLPDPIEGRWLETLIARAQR